MHNFKAAVLNNNKHDLGPAGDGVSQAIQQLQLAATVPVPSLGYGLRVTPVFFRIHQLYADTPRLWDWSSVTCLCGLRVSPAPPSGGKGVHVVQTGDGTDLGIDR